MSNLNKENAFDQVLDQDEKVLLVLKPNKKRMLYLNNMFGRIICVLFGLALILSGAFAKYIFPNDESNGVFSVVFILCGLFFIICLVVEILCYKAMYNKTFYAVTNKRVLVRTGIIGVDYRNLDISFIGSINVNVGIYDKMIKPNTGTISFGSFAAPITVGNGLSLSFNFSCVDEPYEVFKKIKSLIDETKIVTQK